MHTVTPRLIHASLGQPESNPNDISIRSAIFAQLMTECRRTCPGMSFPLKISHSLGAIWTTSNTRFLRPTLVQTTNGISIGSADFAGLSTVIDRPTDGQTDRPRYSHYSVCNGPHVRTPCLKKPDTPVMSYNILICIIF